ncbi:MAG: UvrD-helicase domain-containing protein, partial [Eubacterium sp.]|nr:UvrD-helicase domain-containing protein [Eubacterium sp.]
MANPGWTDEQKSVIDARGREILVSAAAGSGKTAVLVERVYKEVMEGIDLDRFVVVTFTKAAAAEMKERLRKRFEEALEDEKLPDVHRQRIRRQLRLIPSAHISTVHSFCNYIIGQYFHRIGIDPSYSLASDSELKLIKKEVVSELLERQYELLEENGSMMEKISASSAFTKSDAALEDLIISVYEKSVSEPFPDIVFSDWETMLNAPLDSEDSPYIRELLKRTADTMSWVCDCSDDLLNKYYLLQDKDKKTFVGLKNISIKITDIFEDYNNKNITVADCFEEMRKAFIQMDLSGFPKSKPSKDELRIKAFMELKPVRELVEKTYSDYFSKTLSEHDEDRAAMAETTLELIGLAREFGEKFDAAKRDRGLVDYNDLEQFALRILFDKDSNGRPVRSDAARELSGYFHEIMIDEYQDSNRVQDTILWAIAKPDGTYDESADLMPWEAVAGNRFMVGDIKQSIYRFRNACPELFEHKMNTYRQLDRSTETVSDEGAELTDRDSAGSGQIRIDLHRNFRSGRIIIDSTNEVFKRIMHSDIGGVEYDRDAELVMGLDAEAVPDDINAAARVCIENLYHDRENTDTVTGKSMSNDEAGAYYIANRIKEMVEGDDPLMIRTGRDSFRPVRYRDIVILSRSVSPISYIYSDVFAAVGVPFVTELKQGFYGSREVSLIIQMLSVINNPLQDIPLAAVLLSPMVNVTEEELGRVIAVLKQNDIKRSCLYNMIEEYTSGKNTEFSDPGIREKLASFLSFIKEKRQKTYYT